MFGDAGRTSFDAYPVAESDPSKGMIPGREFETIDFEEAERLLDGTIAEDPIVIERGGCTLSIQAMVRSSDAMVALITVEQPDGVQMLHWDDSTNRDKGANFSDDTPLTWQIRCGDGAFADEMIYVDPNKSTDSLLCCYDYMALMGNEGERDDLSLYLRWVDDGSIRDAIVSGSSGHEYNEDAVQHETIPIKTARHLASESFRTSDITAEAGVDSIEVSPLSMTVTTVASDEDSSMGSYEESVRSISFVFDDGTTYTIFDREVFLDNAMIACGYEEEAGGSQCWRWVYVLNRLVDPAAIDHIVIGLSNGDTREILR